MSLTPIDATEIARQLSDEPAVSIYDLQTGHLPTLPFFYREVIDRINSLVDGAGAGGTGLGGTFLATDATYSGGAKGDGVTDDTAAIRAAIAAAAVKGGTVLLPPGTYMVSQNGVTGRCLDLPAKVRLVGYGASTVIMKTSATAALASSIATVYVSGADAAVENLVLDGNDHAGVYVSAREHQSGIFTTTGADRLTVRGVECRFHGGDGIQLNAGRNILVDGVYIHDCDRQGLSITPSGGIQLGHRITASWFYNNYANAIDIEPAAAHSGYGVVIQGCVVDVGGFSNYGIAITGVDDVTVTGCYVRGGTTINTADRVVMTGNYIIDHLGHGCVTAGPPCDTADISGNVLVAAHSVDGIGAVIAKATGVAQPIRWVVANNVIDCTQSLGVNGNPGVQAWSCRDITIIGNTIHGPGVAGTNGAGVQLRASVVALPMRLAKVQGNYIRNFGAKGVTVIGNGAAQIVMADISGNTLDDSAGTMTVGIDLNSDATGALQAYTCMNNTIIGGVATPLAHIPGGSTTPVAAGGSNTGWCYK